MIEAEGEGPEERGRRSRLAEYAEMAGLGELSHGGADAAPSPEATEPPTTADAPQAPQAAPDEIARRRREFAVLLGEFRRTPVLVPLDEREAPLVGEFGGVRWIYAFSDEPALARFAFARGEAAREWTYRRVLGARLLDVGVPAMGVPCGVALDVGGENDEGVLFPPVVGIVPDAAAVDADTGNGGEGPR
ncbi:hypothetical protein K4B79_11515 [Streptomyces lincolnensis]|uniref:hypothetical protein n=1 Tax=Streptomyces lincolnensis TaxID=1915 RepID=UPI001E528287|nr:hypothetical protein [Streptomyces lincolnensis]MCD7438849.1 hypothetical protein [Streptomyces lincolnensis]